MFEKRMDGRVRLMTGGAGEPAQTPPDRFLDNLIGGPSGYGVVSLRIGPRC